MKITRKYEKKHKIMSKNEKGTDGKVRGNPERERKCAGNTQQERLSEKEHKFEWKCSELY